MKLIIKNNNKLISYTYLSTIKELIKNSQIFKFH